MKQTGKKKSTALAVRKRPSVPEVVVKAQFEIVQSRMDPHALARQSRALIAPGGFAHEIVATLRRINYKPLHDRILVLQGTPLEQIGSIIIPDIAREKLNVGLVVAVGKGFREGDQLIPLQVEEGQIVNFAKHYGRQVDIAGYKLLQLRECEIDGAAG